MPCIAAACAVWLRARRPQGNRLPRGWTDMVWVVARFLGACAAAEKQQARMQPPGEQPGRGALPVGHARLPGMQAGLMHPTAGRAWMGAFAGRACVGALQAVLALLRVNNCPARLHVRRQPTPATAAAPESARSSAWSDCTGMGFGTLLPMHACRPVCCILD